MLFVDNMGKTYDPLREHPNYIKLYKCKSKLGELPRAGGAGGEKFAIFNAA